MKRLILCVFVFLVAINLLQSQATNPEAKPTRGWLTVDTIMQDPKWMGISPSNVFWSEDSRRVYFNWRSGGDESDSLYVTEADGGTPRRVTLEERKHLPSRFGSYTNDRKKKLYSRDGDLFLLDVKTNKEIQLTQTQAFESSPRFSFDEKKIVFVKDGNLFALTIGDGIEKQLTNFRTGMKPAEERRTDLQKLLERQQLELFDVLKKRKNDREAQRKLQELMAQKTPKPFYLGQKNASNLLLSPDERFITFVLSQFPTDAKRTIVPNYVTESGYTEDMPGRTNVGEPQPKFEFYVYNVALDSVTQVKPDDVAGIVPPKAPNDTSKSKPKARDVSYNGPYWSGDGKGAFVQIFSQNNKDRWIILLDCEKTKFTTLLDRQHDDAWIGGPGIHGFGFSTSIGWMPTPTSSCELASKRIFFQSEADGWSHLYTVTADGKIKIQLTGGPFEVYGLQMSNDKKRWYFTSNENHFGEHQFYSMPIDGGTRTRITTLEGFNDVDISPNEDRLAVLYSFSNKPPELHLMDNKPGARATRITESTSPLFRSYDWRAPEVLTFKARDGANVPARLYKPEHANGAAVIFVHGAGYLQNAHKGWSEYFHEYMFHNLLADKGYTVLDMDYRGSAGLGRDWRIAIYRYMGGKDLDDQVDGAKFLVHNHGIDEKRIGLYGGSYGGFLTLMAMFTQPDVFAAGAALRPVTDWSHYNNGYTSGILNIPQEDSIAYYRSSPIFHAEGLKGALLICHGVVDQNVHFQDAVQLVERLIELKKEDWQLAIYPVEDHGFREPTSWIDEYKRILKLFDINLQKP
jgi:dipeptidyl aminopeptidase/acylaminoacyl peptidase